MFRKLTPEAIQQLNALLAQGIPFEEAMARASSWEEVTSDQERALDPHRPPPRPRTTLVEVTLALDELFAQLDASGIVPREAAMGCSWEEIEALEHDTQRRLPRAYAHFLHRVGRARTRLISHNHIAAELHHLRSMQRRGALYMAKRKLEMPPSAFFMLSALGDSFHYVVCDDPDAIDAVVWIAQDAWDEPRPYYNSILELIEDLARRARHAWDSGYFASRPEGTSA